MLITPDVTAVASLLLSRPGAVAAYPTETFYGLGALIHDRAGLGRIVAAKGRDAARGMIVLVADMAMAAAIATIDGRQREFLEKVWPGPVSVLLEAVQGPDPLLAPEGKVALRISPDALATALVRLVGPITSTSANRTGEPPARTADEVKRQGLDIDAVLEGPRTPGGRPSTLIDLTIWPPACLREGVVAFADLLDMIR
ncbi:MAG TPA: L-threonylcarbamoyladenylate synthase [Deltaproteobacteria bacterium]|nr:L-threonylcarbamoyladenylate synthase [Deltaproteobacteria bacterium]